LIKKVTKGKQKQANPEDIVIYWSNIDLETPKSSAKYVTRSSKKSQYVQKYGVSGLSKSARSQRYQKYGEAGSLKSTSPRIETLRLERPQLIKSRSESGRDHRRSRNKSDRSPPYPPHPHPHPHPYLHLQILHFFITRIWIGN
jgi:hypothetical protein